MLMLEYKGTDIPIELKHPDMHTKGHKCGPERALPDALEDVGQFLMQLGPVTIDCHESDSLKEALKSCRFGPDKDIKTMMV
jgi:hypothetical protein